jgi:ABC-2 type transport system ATP-binding protein
MMAKDLLAALAAAGKTVLYSSHVLDVVERFCDRVLIIHQGNLIADGSPSELKVMRREASLEGVFRDMTQAVSAEPLVSTIMESLLS